MSATDAPGSGPDLIGHNWLSKLKLNWQAIFTVNTMHHLKEEQPFKLKNLVSKYPDGFRSELGILKGTTAKIYVNQGAQPKYCKARPVPYAMKPTIEDGLDMLVKTGIVEPVQCSDRAALIVPVLKPNGKVRIWGYYKLTVNQVSNLDNYPIPKTEDLYNIKGPVQVEILEM